jgi:hypothetical protein
MSSLARDISLLSFALVPRRQRSDGRCRGACATVFHEVGSSGTSGMAGGITERRTEYVLTLRPPEAVSPAWSALHG